ncbi:MAG: hypothetical protein CVT67_03495 [Actinobacteria bacterium HGW-Actinobacteria-7]|nr:MAG: hypothetical protein CVT67_03495 [Actinobacteria bacterium HGW-Actinobacteria-7]
MADYTAQDAQRDLDLLRAQAPGESVEYLAEYIERLEARTEAAERVCRAAAEVAAPTVKRDLMQHRQTRFLRELAEWREMQK